MIKVKIGNVIYDAEKEPIVIVFKDDAARRFVADQLSNMHQKEGKRAYLVCPGEMKLKDREDFINDAVNAPDCKQEELNGYIIERMITGTKKIKRQNFFQRLSRWL